MSKKKPIQALARPTEIPPFNDLSPEEEALLNTDDLRVLAGIVQKKYMSGNTIEAERDAEALMYMIRGDKAKAFGSFEFAKPKKPYSISTSGVKRVTGEENDDDGPYGENGSR